MKVEPISYLSEIKHISQDFDTSGKPLVFIELNNADQAKHLRITTEFIREPLALFSGRKIIVAPLMLSPLAEGKKMINGNVTIQETNGMVNWLQKSIEN